MAGKDSREACLDVVCNLSESSAQVCNTILLAVSLMYLQVDLTHSVNPYTPVTVPGSPDLP